jgi:hypothetical protein
VQIIAERSPGQKSMDASDRKQRSSNPRFGVEFILELDAAM